MIKIKYSVFFICLMLFCSNVLAYEKYEIGKKITYIDDEEYYVIENSDNKSKYVTLLKALPLSQQEINKYSGDINNDSYPAHIPYVIPGINVTSNYEFNYADSFPKAIIDYWVGKYTYPDDLAVVDGYKARLLNSSDLQKLGYNLEPIKFNGVTIGYKYITSNPVEWLNYNNETLLTEVVYCWTECVNNQSERAVYLYDSNNGYFWASRGVDGGIIRPVINLKKTAIQNQTDYSIGSEIYDRNGEKYNIIQSDDDYVVALKWEPLTQDIFNSASSNSNGFVSFYSSNTCSYEKGNLNGCTNDYNQSNVKKIVDAWARDKFLPNDLIKVGDYSARILTKDDLINNLGYKAVSIDSSGSEKQLMFTDKTPDFVYKYNDQSSPFWYFSTIDNSKIMEEVLKYSNGLYVYEYSQVRPVVHLSKCALGDDDCVNEDEMVCKEGTTPVTKKVLKYNKFSVGDEVKINNEETYYVIKKSGVTTKSVVLMKADPLNETQVNKYINPDYFISVEGEVPYLLNDNCRSNFEPGCEFVPFNDSTIFSVISKWANDTFEEDFLQEVDNYKVRLISIEELKDNLFYIIDESNTDDFVRYINSSSTPEMFLKYHNQNLYEWTMTSDDSNDVYVFDGKFATPRGVNYLSPRFLRPVIVVNKEDIDGGSYEKDVIIGCETEDGEFIPVDPIITDGEEVIEVENTLSTTSLISMIISIILIATGSLVLYFNYKKNLIK